MSFNKYCIEKRSFVIFHQIFQIILCDSTYLWNCKDMYFHFFFINFSLICFLPNLFYSFISVFVYKFNYCQIWYFYSKCLYFFKNFELSLYQMSYFDFAVIIIFYFLCFSHISCKSFNFIIIFLVIFTSIIQFYLKYWFYSSLDNFYFHLNFESLRFLSQLAFYRFRFILFIYQNDF
jgi:hypothetical protein